MSLKKKSYLVIALLLLLKLAMVYLIVVEYRSNSKQDIFNKINFENTAVFSDISHFKSQINQSNQAFDTYIYNRDVRDLKKYDSLVNDVAVAVNKMQQKYKQTLFYDEILQNKALAQKLIGLKTTTDSLLQNLDSEVEKSEKTNTVPKQPAAFNYKDVLQSIDFETNKTVDTVKKKGFFSRIGNAINGKTDVQKEMTNSTLKLRFGKEVVTGTIKEQLENVLVASQKHYNQQFIRLKANLKNIKAADKQLIIKNQNIVLVLNNFLYEFENALNTFAEASNASLKLQQEKDAATRKKLIIVVGILSFVLLLLLLSFVRTIFKIKQKLAQANQQIQDDIQLKNKVISLLTHEIKTPVSVIAMSSYLISEKLEDQEVKEIFGSIQYTSNALTLIANQALDLVKSNGISDLEFNLTQFDIVFEVHEIIKSLQIVAQSNGMNLVLQSDAPHSLIVNYDKVRLYQLLYNIVGNALKFAKKDIHISLKKNTESLIFEITDDGSGVSEVDLKHIFDLNYQAKDAKQSDTLSMGLGLHLCKKIVEKSKGTISVTNNTPRGTKVVFDLDLQSLLPITTSV